VQAGRYRLDSHEVEEMATRFITAEENYEDYKDRYQAIITLPKLTEEALEKLLADSMFGVFLPKDSADILRKQFKDQMKEKK